MPTSITIEEYLYAIFPARPFGPISDEREDQQWHQIHFLFGEATLWAQAYEDGMARFVVMAEGLAKRSGKTAEEIWKLTLGALQKEYRRYCLLEDLHVRQMAALKTRNSLAHNFYRRRMKLLESTEGREEVIQELQDAITLFQTERDEMYWNLSLLNGQDPL